MMDFNFSPTSFSKRIIDSYPGIESLVAEENHRHDKDFMFDGKIDTILKNKEFYGSKYKECFCHFPLPTHFRGIKVDNPEIFFNFQDILELCLNWSKFCLEVEFDHELEEKIHAFYDVGCPAWDPRINRTNTPGFKQEFYVGWPIFVRTNRTYCEGKEVYGVFAYQNSILKIYTDNTMSYLHLKIPVYYDNKGRLLRDSEWLIRRVPPTGIDEKLLILEKNLFKKFPAMRKKEVSGLELILAYLHHAKFRWYKTVIDNGIVRLYNERPFLSKSLNLELEFKKYIPLSIKNSRRYPIPTSY